MDGKINYSISGTGPAVVLLHGLMEELHVWDDFAQQLSEYFQVVCIDLPGHGESSIFGEIHTMSLMAECVNAVLEANEIDDCVMAGHSMGGYVTAAFSKMYPEKIRGMCFLNSQVQAETEESRQNRDRAVAAIMNDKGSFIAGFIRNLFTQENRERHKDEIDRLVERARQMNPEAIAAAQLGMKERESGITMLIEAPVPVLFIAGKHDPVIPIDKVMAQAILPKHSEVLILGNAAHMALIEAKQEVMDMIESFADRCFSYKSR